MSLCVKTLWGAFTYHVYNTVQKTRKLRTQLWYHVRNKREQGRVGSQRDADAVHGWPLSPPFITARSLFLCINHNVTDNPSRNCRRGRREAGTPGRAVATPQHQPSPPAAYYHKTRRVDCAIALRECHFLFSCGCLLCGQAGSL